MKSIFQCIVIIVVMNICTSYSITPNASISFFDSIATNDTIIRIKDIGIITTNESKEQLHKAMNVIIGESAPAGFFRLVNTDDILCYVLRQANCGLTFSKASKKVIKVTTGFQEKKISDFSKVIESYIRDSVKWQPEDFTVSLRNGEDSFKFFKTAYTVSVHGLPSKFPKGIVNLKLVVNQGSKTCSIPIRCNVTVVTNVVVSKSSIPRGTALTPENCTVEKRDITSFAFSPIISVSDIKNVMANRTIPVDAIIHEKITKKIPIIEKDEQVFVVSDKGAIRISIIMRAREPGAIGEKIWVENEMSHKLLKTKIIGKGKVELLEGEKSI